MSGLSTTLPNIIQTDKRYHTCRESAMGKGDQRTRRGKLFSGSYGKARPRKKTKKGKAG
jgi:30S ribosomal protein S31